MPSVLPPDFDTLEALRTERMGSPELSIIISVFNEDAISPSVVEGMRSFVARLSLLVIEIKVEMCGEQPRKLEHHFGS